MQDHPRAPSDLPDALTARTSFLLQLAVARVQEMGEAALVDLGITGREYGVLAMLETGAAPTQRRIAATLGLDRTTTTTLLATLESRGLVERIPQPGNRRANSVTLTSVGENLRSRAESVLAECEERFLTPLSVEQQSAMRDGLLRVIRPTAG